MKVLHISNDFPNSNLYKQLVLHIDDLDIQQGVFSAVRTKQESNFENSELNHLNLVIHNILKPYDRLLYRLKVQKVFKHLLNHMNISDIDLVHAHTLYSDGGVALKLKKTFGIPYIAALRSTDMNSFQKYRPDLRLRRNKILREAEKIILLSPAHRNEYLSMLGNGIARDVENKIETVPNGIDPLFLEPRKIKSKNKNKPLKILYVGTFIKRKNVLNLINAIKILSETRPVKLTLVGGGGDFESEVKSTDYSFLDYKGRITDRRKLREVYRDHDIFAMVSRAETFGLVYIEALSQGVPIVHKKDDAVDGYFEENTVSEVVSDWQNPDKIAEKINALAERLSMKLSEECISQAQRFSWPKIASTYKDIYISSIKN